LSGVAIASHGVDPAIVVIGAEPETVADAHRSLAAGELAVEGNATSIADGLLAVLSPFTFGILSKHVREIVTVSEQEIVDAMALLFTRAKQVVEPSGATALAGLRVLGARRGGLPDDVGLVLSGGNVDLTHLPFTSGGSTDDANRE
jgi:threonine dehydratase